jgi:hypothetical protein
MHRASLASTLALTVGLAFGLPAAAWSGTPPPPCLDPASDLVHHWRGDGNAEDTAGDTDGTVSGATFTAGRFGQAFSFDGVDDLVSFGPTVGNFGVSDFTVGYWIKSDNLSEIQGVLGKRLVCMHSSFWDNRLGPSGTMNVELDQDALATNHNSIATAATMNDAAFHLFAFSREGATLRLYVDGVLSASGTTAGTSVISNAADLIAGKSACTGFDGTTSFDGDLDEIKIYDRALTACEVLVGEKSGLDVDLDGSILPLTDMLLLLRYAFSFRGATLITGATGTDCLRCDAQSLEVVIGLLQAGIDVDGNGSVEPLTDTLLLLRYAFGFRGPTLVNGATGSACTRCTAMLIEGFLDPLFP